MSSWVFIPDGRASSLRRTADGDERPAVLVLRPDLSTARLHTRVRLALKELVQNILRDVETRLPQVVYRIPKIEQPLVRCRPQDAQRAGEGQMPPLGFLPPSTFIDDELIGVDFFS